MFKSSYRWKKLMLNKCCVFEILHLISPHWAHFGITWKFLPNINNKRFIQKKISIFQYIYKSICWCINSFMNEHLFSTNYIVKWMRIFGPVSARSYKIGVFGNNWLVGNAVFSETALKIFLIFSMNLGKYKGRKVTEWRYFEKTSWFGDIRENVSKLAQNQTLWYFSQKRL